MNLRYSALAAVAGTVLLATSTTAVAEMDAYGARDQAKLAKALAGRAPGKPIGCIGNGRGSRMQVIDDNTILFKEGGTVYVQKPRGGCHGLASNTLVTRIAGSNRLCRGQIGDVVDPVSGFSYGSCVFDDFVPYRKVR